ncbi:MAG TPA: cupin domain-containing protein, partial [Xenococcaceae cyanobacterium]
MLDKQKLIEYLSLIEHIEGGYFKETYRSGYIVPTDRVGKARNILTSIYYLLTDERPIDYFHKNQSDIIHYFHCGSPVT